MSAPDSLKEVYLDEMQDLWSANDQMVRAVQELGGQVSDANLKRMLDRSVDGIRKHTDVLKSLIRANGGEPRPEPCKGMEGLVAEALKHGIKAASPDPRLRDVAIIAQYQRMSHYGLAGFGSAAAYAKALGRTDDASKLKQAVDEIDEGDAAASQLAEAVERAAA
ncbi:ferritin-like domain-containing protein [Methylobacterium radiotolerans]|uniref:YciE/YciF ferroxidase family protein n=1 Tax=Methylobacterium radiotolerans TaxID=31998 RepID=UPI0015F572F8|nr:ferritin-like domain-containing protein [Methylobacterium radiotolerans]